MATTAEKADTLFLTSFNSGTATDSSGVMKRRSIDPRTGDALVILGHAIEYLTDEVIFEGGSLTANRGQIDAIQLLIRSNREIYMACPEAPSIGSWLRSFLFDPIKKVSKAVKVPAGFNHGGA